MSRLAQLDDVLFPVEEHPIFASIHTESGEQRIAVPDRKAIVNKNNNRVLGVVGRDYRLVTNREALDWAFECCQKAFPETKPLEWEVKATDAPATGGNCSIDLVHSSAKLDFFFIPAKDRPDAFGPFIRVTNSYNGLRALAFNIGLHRKVCSNGLILPQSVIRFKVTHSKRDIGQGIDFQIAIDRFSKIKTRFSEDLSALRACRVVRAEFESVMFAALLIRQPAKSAGDRRAADDWNVLLRHVGPLCDRYSAELGENAYAVFNVITEFASNVPENRCVHRDRHSFQRLAGEWTHTFSRACREPGFSVSEFITTLPARNGNGERLDDRARWLRDGAEG